MIFYKQLKITSALLTLQRLIIIPFQIALAYILSKIIMYALKGDIQSVSIYSIILILLVAFKCLISCFLGIFTQKKEIIALHKCKISLYNNYFNNSLSKLFSSQYGDTVEILTNDFNSVTEKWVSLMPNLISGLVMSISYLFFLGMKSPIIAISLFLISLLQIIPPIVVKKYMQRNYLDCRDIESDISNLIVEGIQGISTMKMYSLQNWWLNRMTILHKKYIRIGNISEATFTFETAIDELLNKILTFGTYGLLGLFVISGWSSLNVCIQAVALSASFYGSIKSIFSVIPDLAVSKIAETRLTNWYSTDVAQEVKMKDTKIKLKNISVCFEDKHILDRSSISFDAKSINVIKGENGIGKSSLFHLIVGLIEKDSGIITVGGIEPEKICESSFKSDIFYLPQNDPEFMITPHELYKYVVPEKTVQAQQIAQNFGIDNITITNTKICELSGGERKKIFLALAFAINPKIMLLDEPTNSLDSKGKKILTQMLYNRKSGAMIITHDDIFNSIAQNVYVIEEGAIHRA